MTVKNLDFLGCREERKKESFFKVLQSADISSENMRALPLDFVRNLSEKELSRKMKIRAKWGSSWEIEVCKNPRFYFMEKSGWEKLLREIGLADIECLIFTHQGKFRFTLNIFKPDGSEMLQLTAFLASSSRVKTEQGGTSTDDRDVKKEEVVLSSDLSYLGSTTAETSGAGKYKRKLSFDGKKKKKKKGEESQSRKKRQVSVGRDSAGAPSSSSLGEFTVLIKKSYLVYLPFPLPIAQSHLPQEDTSFIIHHSDKDKERSWKVAFLARTGIPGSSATFSAGWRRLATQYPLAVGDKCKFTKLKDGELLLQVN